MLTIDRVAIECVAIDCVALSSIVDMRMYTKRQDDALLRRCGVTFRLTVYVRKEKLPITLGFERCYPEQPASEPAALQAVHCLEHVCFAAPPKPLP